MNWPAADYVLWRRWFPRTPEESWDEGKGAYRRVTTEEYHANKAMLQRGPTFPEVIEAAAMEMREAVIDGEQAGQPTMPKMLADGVGPVWELAGGEGYTTGHVAQAKQCLEFCQAIQENSANVEHEMFSAMVRLLQRHQVPQEDREAVQRATDELHADVQELVAYAFEYGRFVERTQALPTNEVAGGGVRSSVGGKKGQKRAGPTLVKGKRKITPEERAEMETENLRLQEKGHSLRSAAQIIGKKHDWSPEHLRQHVLTHHHLRKKS